MLPSWGNLNNCKGGNNSHRHRPVVHKEGEIQFALSDFQDNSLSHLCPLSMKKKQRWLINSGNVSDKEMCLDALLEIIRSQSASPISIILYEPSKSDVKKLSKFVVLRQSAAFENNKNGIYKDYQLVENRNKGNVGNLTKSIQQALHGRSCIQVQTIQPGGVPLNASKNQSKRHSRNIQRKMLSHYLDEDCDEADDSLELEELENENSVSNSHKTVFYRQPKVNLMQQVKCSREKTGKKLCKQIHLEDDLQGNKEILLNQSVQE